MSNGRKDNLMKLTVCLRSSILLTTLITPLSLLQAQSNLTLSSASVPAGGTAQLNLSLSSVSGQPANIQWTFNYPAASVANLVVSPVADFNSTGKTISCAGGTGFYKCVTWGLTPSTVPNGVIATVSVTLSGTSDAPVTITDSLGRDAGGRCRYGYRFRWRGQRRRSRTSEHGKWSYGYRDHRIRSDDQLDHW